MMEKQLACVTPQSKFKCDNFLPKDSVMRCMLSHLKLTSVAEGFKVSAISSVVTGKEIEAEILSLQNNLEDIEREWPRLPTLSKEFLKKEKVIREKILVDVKKKVKQGERMIKTAAENATAANSTAKSTEESADALAKAAKASFTQGKRTKQASAQLSSVLDVKLEQLTELEGQAGEKQEVMLVEEDMLFSESVMSNMETARSQLESFTEILSELLKNLDEKVALQNFDHILNTTAARLHVLKAAVESPALTGKIQELHGAAHSQEKQLQSLEENLFSPHGGVCSCVRLSASQETCVRL